NLQTAAPGHAVTEAAYVKAGYDLPPVFFTGQLLRREHMNNIPRRWCQSIASACTVVAALAVMICAAPAAAQKTQLLVYTALEADQIKAYEDGFVKANPNIEIKWVRDSTGIITAKIVAEKA